MKPTSLIARIRAALRAAVKVFRIRLDGEPIFVLRGQDVIAEKCVRDWAARALNTYDAAPPYAVRAAKVQGALEIADAMKAWPIKRVPD